MSADTSHLRIGVAGFSSMGGSGVVAAELAMAMGQRGHQVFVLSDERPVRLRRDSPNVGFRQVASIDYPLLAQRSYALALAAEMVDLARAERLDLLHVHYAVPHAISAFLAMSAMDEGGPKLLTTVHGTDVTLVGRDRLLQPLLRLALRQSHGLSAPSRWLADAARAQAGLPAEAEIAVIPNFVDREHFHPRAHARERARRTLVHVSNFRPVKRVHDVVRVFAAVRSQRSARLLLVGDGPERQSCAALASSLGLDGHVEFVGERADVAELLAEADVLLLPSASEGFGLAALEAMACGVPVVGTAVGGLPEVVEDGVSGFLTPVGDVAAMTGQVVRLLDDDELYRRASDAARGRVHRCFAPATVISRYEELYRRLVAS